MYGIGIFEIFLIFLILLLFFRPAEILNIFRRLGAWYRKIRKLEDDLMKEWDADDTGKTGRFGFDVPDESDKEGHKHDR
jgi:Sec-independent protein translocase protein TatA